MIIDEEYIVSAFYLIDKTILFNSMFYEGGGFNLYKIVQLEKDGVDYMKLYYRKKESETVTNEVMLNLIPVSSLAYLEVKSVDELNNEQKELLGIFKKTI